MTMNPKASSPRRGFAAFAFLLSLAGSEARAAEAPARFLLAHGAISGNTTPLWIAKEQGFFRKHGVDPQLVFIIAGRAAQAMLAGEVNVGVIGATHVTNAVTAGADLAMLLGLENKLNYLLVARPGIKSGEDLKGKKIAIGTPAGSASLATYVALDHLGVVPRRDHVVLLQVGGVPERLAALLAGSVDATSLAPETAQVATSQGFVTLLDLAKENVPFQSSGLVTSRRFLRANPGLVENLAKAIVEAVAFTIHPANKSAVMQTIGKHLRLDKPERLEKAYQSVVHDLPRIPCPSVQGTASVLRLMGQHGLNPKAASLKPEDLLELSLCRKLEETGFFDRLYGKS
jgi:NitT/TauT family transport system substrate-binding protein